MDAWCPYNGESYLNWDAIEGWCRQTAQHHPEWVSIETVGHSREGRPLLLLTIGKQDGHLGDRPAFWLDGGTHAAEWTGVMAALYAVSDWAQKLASDDAHEVSYFSRHTIYVMPCISPDGLEAMFQGAPFIRSSVRPAPNGAERTGLDPQDMDGDGAVRWMRWPHPAGPYVLDPDVPMFMRPRRLDDDPEDAWFLCPEGLFLDWDGIKWTKASAKFGLDLNRNFPAHWGPFTMFGMDGGVAPLCEPESRAVVDTFCDRPNIAAGLTNHTYTGCILSQPYRENTPLEQSDIRLLERMAHDAVEGTDYRVLKVVPDFVYDPKKSVVGVWSDTMSTTFGVPAYTLELWDPFKFSGVENERPAEFFSRPDPEKIRSMVQAFSQLDGAVTPWTDFDHPQLRLVQIGGLDYLRTVRNPPEHLLAEECERGRRVADRLRRALPRVEGTVSVHSEGGELSRVDLVLENYGFLSTSGLAHGATLPGTLPVEAKINLEDGLQLDSSRRSASLAHLDGWGSYAGGGLHSVYPSLPGRGHRDRVSWWVRGAGNFTVEWVGGRGGKGQVTCSIKPS